MIRNISIKGLFDRYDYSFSLHSTGDDIITFITGSNGSGKSTILRMLNSMYFMNWDELVSYTFQSFEVELDSSIILFERLYRPQKTAETSNDVNSKKVEDFELSVKYSELGLESSCILGRIGEFSSTPNSLAMALSLDKPHYIDDQRLSYSYNDFGEVVEAKRLDDCRIDCKKKLQDIKSKVNDILSPFNILTNNQQKDIDSTLLGDLYENLRNLGVLGVKPLENISKDSDEYTKLLGTMNTLYQEFIKSDVYNTYESILAFANLIDSYQFDSKSLEFSIEYGFRFKSNEGKFLTLSQLSSGEQQVLLQAYELIFIASKDSIILIDEPETSQHLAWQLNYFQNLKQIAANRHLQCIVATHLPLMFENNFSLAVDLYTLSHPEDF